MQTVKRRDLLFAQERAKFRAPRLGQRLDVGTRRGANRLRRHALLLDQAQGIGHASMPSCQAATEAAALDDVVREVVADAEFEAAGQGKHVRLQACEPLLVRAAAISLRCAVENVVRNAIRHTPANSCVQVSLVKTMEPGISKAILSVRDFGPGVPEANLADILRPFFRVGDARQRSDGGAGLGLSIAQRINHAAQGSVAARNATGGGLCVEFVLPVVQEMSGTDRGDRPTSLDGHRT